MTTMEEIAKKAGVSQATVSRVINGSGLVSEETRQKVMQWARKMEYLPNFTAQSLVRKQSFLIGVVLPDITNPYFTEILKVIENEANISGYSVIFCDSGNNAHKEKSSFNMLRSRQVDGILFAPADPFAPYLKALRNSKTPVVSITRNLDGFDSVSISHQFGGEVAAMHLLQKGHTEVGFIGAVGEEKYEGFIETFRRRQISIKAENLIDIETPTELWSSNTIHEKFNEYLSACKKLRVTGIFASTDLSAFIVSHILRERGYRIPNDVALVGFDNTYLSAQMRPTLTSVAQPISEIGHQAMEILFNRISEGSNQVKNKETMNLILEPHLVARESTRKA